METFGSMTNFLCSLPATITCEIQNAFVKAWGHIHGYSMDDGTEFTMYKKIMVSISGGADSDILLDLIERIGHPLSEVHYVFFDTGLEFAATKQHLEFLERKYGITIERYRAKRPVPLGVQKYGVPFLSKQVSQYISRLQKHGFSWEDKPFEELYAEYPRCKAALRWWCNLWGKNSKLNISNHIYLKEFMVANPPDFSISDGCCTGAKKDTAHSVERLVAPDLCCQGTRKAEGGARATVYSSCFDKIQFGADQFRPIFWFKKDDKRAYEIAFDIVHSDCYRLYGLDRTGCACCPFGRNFERELAAAERYEPNLYKAAIHIFGKSYEYTRQYRDFVKRMKNKGGERQPVFRLDAADDDLQCSMY